MFNGVRALGSYSQVSWVLHFLQNKLPRSIVIVTSLPIGTLQLLINMIFTKRAMACQSAISGTFKDISLAKARAPGALPMVVATVVCMACIAVANATSIMSRA